MKHCRETMWLLVAICVLMPAGCALQGGRFANKNEVNTAQLLAAARQYEKEGQAANAAHIYQHVLKYHPTNNEAKQGLALVQQGKLRVEYDTEQLLASTDPTIQGNPQARELLARQQKAQREQVTEQMAQIIAAAAANPTKINVDPTPTPTMVASITGQSDALESAGSAAQGSQLVILEAQPVRVAKPDEQTPIAQADAIAEVRFTDSIETTAFTESETIAPAEEATPADWSQDSAWRPRSHASLCQDANAAVLLEVRRLDSHVDEIRKQGLTNLARMGAEAASAEPAIRRLLEDNNQLVAAHAAWAAWEVQQDASLVLDTLEDLLDSPSTDVVQFAAYTLGSIGQPVQSAAPKLRELLAHEESVTRLHAAEALIQIAGPAQRAEAVDTLMILLKDQDAQVRSLAAMMLGVADAQNAEAAVASLLCALDDEDDRVRSAAALSLGAYGTKADFAVEKLQDLARQDHTDVRKAAQTALSCITL